MLSSKLAGTLQLFDSITKLPSITNRPDYDKAWADYEAVMGELGAELDSQWFGIGYLVACKRQDLAKLKGMSLLTWQYWMAYVTAVSHQPALEAQVPYELIRKQAEQDLNSVFQRLGDEYNLLELLGDYVARCHEQRMMSRDFIRLFNGMFRMLHKQHRFNHPDFRNTDNGAFSFSARFIQQYYHYRQESNAVEAMALTLESVGLASVVYPLGREDKVGRAVGVLREFVELGTPSCSNAYNVYLNYCQMYSLVATDSETFTRDYLSLGLRQLESLRIIPLELPFWLALTIYDVRIYFQPEQALDTTLEEARDILASAYGRSDGEGRRHTLFVLRALITALSNTV